MRSLLYARLTFCFTVLVLVPGGTLGSYKRWLPDTNLDNPANWNVKRTPCGNDVVIIPDESPVMYIQSNMTLKELVLPQDGEIVLGLNSGFGFTDQANSRCPDAGGDVEFTAVHPEAWFDPSNWCTSKSQVGACAVPSTMLDVQRVPCPFDDVVFPRQHSYFIGISPQIPTVTVKSLKMSGSSFTTSTFSSYLKSGDGKRLFKVSDKSKVKVTRKSCDVKKGCPCGNDRPKIAKQICSHVTKTCKRPRCSNAIQPVGACCRMCGATLKVTGGYGFDFKSFKGLVELMFFKNESTAGINRTIYLTNDGWIQIALHDVTGERSASLASQIKAAMDQDLSKGGHFYGIEKVELTSVSSALSGNPSLGPGSVAGIVIAVIICLAVLIIIVLIFMLRRNGTPLPIPKLPSMPSFRTSRNGVRVQGQPQTASHIDPGFANPLYDTAPFDDRTQTVKEMELIAASQEEQPTFDASDAGFNNPLYGATAPQFHDPTKSDGFGSKDKPETAAETPLSSASHTTTNTAGNTKAKPASTPATIVLVDTTADKEKSSGTDC